MLELPTLQTDRWQPLKIRVPREDRSVLCRPDWEDVVAAVPVNAELLNGSAVNIQGRTLQHLRTWTARDIHRSAVDYTATIIGNTPEETTDLPTGFVVGGHQPSLFHPGVWAKNFAIDKLARKTGRRALNLVVDNDTFALPSLRVPVGSRENPHVQTVDFDRQTTAQPWEESRVTDPEIFRSFGSRVSELMSAWTIDPLIAEIWPDVESVLESGGGLRDCLTAARSRLEQRWGLRNLELPISRMCEIDPFLWFASHLFAHAQRFREIHNTVLDQYRIVNQVRSRTHPVPELTQDGEWTESPFWIWREGATVRRRAFVRQVGREVELTDLADVTVRFPLSPEMDACCAVEALREIPSQGIRLRTRALTTTLFSRLCVADLFVHGIGGAKYDEMTDRIIGRFFGLRAPTFAAISATVHLPLGEPFDETDADVRRLQQQLRDYRYNADRSLSSDHSNEMNELVEEKRRLIADQETAKTSNLSRRERRLNAPTNHARFVRLQKMAAQLAEFSATEQREVREKIARVQGHLASNAVLKNREFSFALYPSETLHEFLTTLFESFDP